MDIIHESSENSPTSIIFLSLQPYIPSTCEEVSEIAGEAAEKGSCIIRSSATKQLYNINSGSAVLARSYSCESDGIKYYSDSIPQFHSDGISNFMMQPNIHTTENHYTCYKCDYSSVSKSNFIVHLKRHSGETAIKVKMLDIITRHNCEQNLFQRNECDYETVSSSKLKDHRVAHNSEKLLQCELCDFNTANKSTLKIHCQTHTGEKPFKCDVCNFSTITNHSLQTHKKTHSVNRSYNCRECDFRTTRKKDLESHQKAHSGDKQYGEDTCEFSLQHKHKINIQKIHADGEHAKCKAQPTQKYKITVHNAELKLSECTQKQKFKTKCNRKIGKSKNSNKGYKDFDAEDADAERVERLQVHKKIYIGRTPYECDKCEYFSVDKYKFTIHQRIHSGERPFKCNECGFSSAYKSVLKIHHRTHTGEKPFKCVECNFSSVTNSGLRVHKRIHTGEKPFKCSVCEFYSARKRDLEYHLRTHTGEKPYKCADCDYEAATSSQLKVHERIHSGEKPFQCDKCEYCSSQRYRLIIHQRIHTGEKPYKCSKCDYHSSQKCKIKLHEKRIHTTNKSIANDIKIQESEFNNIHSNKYIENKSPKREKNLYQCDKCDFQSVQNYKIEIHQTIHPMENAQIDTLVG